MTEELLAVLTGQLVLRAIAQDEIDGLCRIDDGHGDRNFSRQCRRPQEPIVEDIDRQGQIEVVPVAVAQIGRIFRRIVAAKDVVVQAFRIFCDQFRGIIPSK